MRRVLVVLLVVAFLALAGGAVGWWYMARERHALVGPTEHDFGVVSLPGRPQTVRHVFELTNASSQDIVIDEIKPSCSCLTVAANLDVVAPGATLAVDVAMRITDPVPMGKRVWVVSDDSQLTLWVRALGVVPLAVRADRSLVELEHGEPVMLSLFATVTKGVDEVPPVPTFEPPEGVDATFHGWESVPTPDGRRYRGTVELQAREGVTDVRGGLGINVAPLPRFDISVLLHAPSQPETPAE